MLYCSCNHSKITAIIIRYNHRYEIVSGKVITLLNVIWLIFCIVLYVGWYLYDLCIKKPNDTLNYYKRVNLSDNSMEKKIQDNIIRKQALDEVSRKCRSLSGNGEVIYFSADDIDIIIDELKKKDC